MSLKKKKRTKKKSNYRPHVMRSPLLDEYGDELEEVELDYGGEDEPDEDIFAPAEDKDIGEDIVDPTEGIEEEEGIEYEFKKEPLDIPQHLKELAGRWKLDIKVLQLVPIRVRRKVRNAEMNYANVVKAKIGPTESLQPIRDPDRVIKLIGDEMPPPIPHQKLYSPSKFKVKARKTKITLKPPPSITDLFDKQVTDDMRRFAVDELFRVFSEIIPTEKLVKEEKIQLSNEDVEILRYGIKPFEESTVTWTEVERPGWLVEWEFEGEKLAKLFPVSSFKKSEDVKKEAEIYAKNGYYAENFRNWMYEKLFQKIKGNVPISLLQKAAESIVQQKSDPYAIIQDLVTRYGKDFLNMDALQIKNRLRDNRQGVRLIDVEIQRAFERISAEKLQLLHGRSLAQELTNIIHTYLRKYPPNQNNIYKELESKFISDEFSLYKPTQEDRTLFEAENLLTLKELYVSHIKAFREAEKKVVLMEESVKSKAEKVSSQTDKYVNLSESGREVLLQTQEFERDCYVASQNGITNINYLSKVLRPLVFLEGQLSKFTKFFRAKIASGLFQISALYAADLEYYFPELAMNFNKLSNDEWSDVMTELSKIMLDKINDILELGIRFRFPTARLEHKTTRALFFRWDKYITNITTRCEKDTQTGKRPVRDDEGKIVYKKEKSKMVAQYQPINLADVVVCYDKKEDKFSCHSITEILHDIAKARIEGKRSPINPFTGKPYPKSFVKTIEKRYPEELKKSGILETPEKPKLPWTPEPKTKELYEDLFGASSKEEKIPEEIETLKDLKKVISPKKLTVVYFYADWCKKCKKFEKRWGTLQDKFPKVNFIKVDYDEAKEVVDKYKIKKLPHFLLLKKSNGKIQKLASVTSSNLKTVIEKFTPKKPKKLSKKKHIPVNFESLPDDMIT